MTKKQVQLALLIMSLGFLGVLSILTMELPIPEEAKKELFKKFTPSQVQWLSLINPTVLVTGATFLGVALYPKTKLTLPVFEHIVGIKKLSSSLFKITIAGTIAGVISGALILLIASFAEHYLADEFLVINSQFKPSILGRFLYGGISEEILMRFGLMTFIIYLGTIITKKHTALVYWTAIIFAALLFGVGHLPVVFQSLSDPSPSFITYIILANATAGILFGWIYWRKGLAAAMIAHSFAHVTMLFADYLFS